MNHSSCLFTRWLSSVLVVVPTVFTSFTVTGTAVAIESVCGKNQTVAFLNRVGLAADSFVVCGMSASDLPAVVAAANAQLSLHDAELRSRDEQCLSLRRKRAELQSQVNRNDGTVAIESVATAQSQLEGALAQRDSLLRQMATETIAGLPQDVRELLGAVLRNSMFGVPAQYCVVDRTDSEWAALKSALSGVASASRRQVAASVQDVNNKTGNMPTNRSLMART